MERCWALATAHTPSWSHAARHGCPQCLFAGHHCHLACSEKREEVLQGSPGQVMTAEDVALGKSSGISLQLSSSTEPLRSGPDAWLSLLQEMHWCDAAVWAYNQNTFACSFLGYDVRWPNIHYH